jgi:hypothetical protein
MRLFLALFVLAPLALGGCISRKGADDPEGSPRPGEPPRGTLTLSPADPVLAADGKTPVKVTFQVLRGKEDVTSEATLSTPDAWLGSFQGATFTSVAGAGGRTTVTARVGDDFGMTSLTVRTSAIVIAPGAPNDAPDRFNGRPDPGLNPVLAYPPDKVLIPPNLHELEIQWHKGPATLFEIALVGDAVDLRIYTPCPPAGMGCGLIPDEASWKFLSQAARSRSVRLRLRATTDGGGVGTSDVRTISFANDEIQGGLYYWAASAGGIFRYDFGLRGQKAEPFYTPLHAVATCVGCHALSRNGKRIAAGMNIPGPAFLRTLEVATRTKLFEIPGVPLVSGSDFQAFTSDGERLITVEKNGLTLRDGGSGMIIGQVPQVPNANMPDVSPDNKLVVFARGNCALVCPTLQVDQASLYTVPFMNDTFGAPRELVRSAGENNYYPSFSPDGRFVVFNRSTGSSYDAADARVMIVPAQGGTPIDLASVNKEVGNSWPKWGPFVQKFGTDTILWLTFSSRRAYGLRPVSAAQLWMVPVDVGKLLKGEDPGYPPFRLPFQELGTGNHIAQWVEKVDRAPCTPGDTSKCQPGEVCIDGLCVPVIK